MTRIVSADDLLCGRCFFFVVTAVIPLAPVSACWFQTAPRVRLAVTWGYMRCEAYLYLGKPDHRWRGMASYRIWFCATLSNIPGMNFLGVEGLQFPDR